MPHNHRIPRALALGAAMLATALAAAPAAMAETRYASPASSDTSGSCTTALTPCRLDRAVNVAAPGDTVVVQYGGGVAYNVTYPVASAADIHVKGEDGQPLPRVVGAAGQATPTLSLTGGGTVSRLHIETNHDVALELSNGSRGDGLVLIANATRNSAVAARVFSSNAGSGTVLTNTFARSLAGSAIGVDVVDGSPAGLAKLVNVTAIASGSASWGISVETLTQSAFLKNVIARGTSKDMHGRSSSLNVDMVHSNFRAAKSTLYTDIAGNQTASDPAFVNSAAGDYRPADGSVTIDAGATDASLAGTKDADGKARALAGGVDIGAFEHGVDDGSGSDPAAGTGPSSDGSGGAGAGSGDAGSAGTGDGSGTGSGTGEPGTLAPPAPPQLGSTIGVDTASGETKVRLPGTSDFIPLSDAASIPLGSTIDASRGHVTLTSVRDAEGNLQSGEFWGGMFQVRQTTGPRPMTELVLAGGDFSRCPRASRASGKASAARGRHSARVRRLWGSDNRGRFRSRGRNSHATVRGTVWLVEDRCDGTYTRVKEGAVVVRDIAKRRNVLVKQGHSYLAKKR